MILAIRPLEADPTLGEPIKVRRLHERMSVAADRHVVIVGDNEQDVGFLDGLLRLGGAWQNDDAGDQKDRNDTTAQQLHEQPPLRQTLKAQADSKGSDADMQEAG